MEQTETEMVAELLGLTEELGVIVRREEEIRERSETILRLLASAIELRTGGSQPVKVNPAGSQ
jgi:hypothetical protein